MRLNSMTVHNFRRFRGTQKIHLDEPVIALVGPNEAGKSSLLYAISQYAEGGKFSEADMHRSSSQREADPTVAEYKFLLEEADVRRLSDAPLVDEPKWLIVKQRLSGKQVLELSPTPSRDYAPIVRIVESLNQAINAIPDGNKLRNDPGDSFFNLLWQCKTRLAALAGDRGHPVTRRRHSTAVRQLTQVLRYLGVMLKNDEAAFVSGVSVQQMENMLNPISQSKRNDLLAITLPRKVLNEMADHLIAARSFLNDEESWITRGKLTSLLPRVVYFSDADRDLPAEFELAAENVPQGIYNLLGMAQISLTTLKAAVSDDNYIRVEELMEAANSHLRNALEAWRQVGLWVKLVIHNKILRVLVSGDHGSYTDLSTRSDGLRQFVALLAAVHSSGGDADGQNSQESIILIDEAENHLHYDAQADLVEVLTTQRFAKQVIYSTHSAGCLPEDIGTGVRAVKPVWSIGTSEIQNWFWEDGAGFTPLLIAMGAATLAFSSMRHVVISEGATEMILLPTLLREATAEKTLGYQIAPGLSQVSPDLVGAFDLEAARTCFLVDGDAGGADLLKKLQQAGIPAERAIVLGGAGSNLALEDLIDEEAFRDCLTEALPFDNTLRARLQTLSLPAGSRLTNLKEFCKSEKISPPQKRVMAQLAVKKAKDTGVLSADGTRILKDLHMRISQILGLRSSSG